MAHVGVEDGSEVVHLAMWVHYSIVVEVVRCGGREGEERVARVEKGSRLVNFAAHLAASPEFHRPRRTTACSPESGSQGLASSSRICRRK